MVNQHAKWLKVTNHIPWRRPIASLNYLLSSHVWRQDHNGFSHQDPGFIDHVVNKRAEVVRVTPAGREHPAVHLRSLPALAAIRQRGGRGQQPTPTSSPWSRRSRTAPGTGDLGVAGTEELGRIPTSSSRRGRRPTLEGLAAVDLLKENLPDLKIRFVNVVDLMRCRTNRHPHGLSHRGFDMIFTRDKPVIFAYHGYPWLIHRRTYRRAGHNNLHVRGYKEEGTTTTPFDMVMLNDLDRYHLVIDVIDRVPFLQSKCATLRQQMVDKRIKAREYTREHGDDIPEVRDWVWPDARGAGLQTNLAATVATAGDNE
jgi:xylulose-5-phosphate/fructose-6-phosphate phosphoketolase